MGRLSCLLFLPLDRPGTVHPLRNKGPGEALEGEADDHRQVDEQDAHHGAAPLPQNVLDGDLGHLIGVHALKFAAMRPHDQGQHSAQNRPDDTGQPLGKPPGVDAAHAIIATVAKIIICFLRRDEQVHQAHHQQHNRADQHCSTGEGGNFYNNGNLVFSEIRREIYAGDF